MDTNELVESDHAAVWMKVDMMTREDTLWLAACIQQPGRHAVSTVERSCHSPGCFLVWYGNILFDIVHNNIKYTDSV